MPYAIDGHNLIGQIPGWSLADPEDESRLVEVLARWAARRRVSATVFFDRGAAGLPGTAHRGRLTLRFVRPPRSADEAIASLLDGLGRGARSWTVVSSDRDVEAIARRAGARTLTSREFARDMWPSGSGVEEKPGPIDTDEVDAWLREFRKGKSGRDK